MIRQLLSWLFKRPNIKVTSGVEIYRMPRTALIWILASLTAVILPHISRMPIWLTLLCACCIGTSILIFQGRLSHPGSKIKTAIVFIVLVSIVAQYGRDIFSTDAIVGVLVVGIALKLLEMKKKRDVLMVIYLCYFTVLAEFIYSQSIPIAIYMMLTVLVITSALMSITQTEEYQRPMRTLKLSGIVLLQSIPLMAILFLIFPRISPFWAVPLQSTSGITGLSDEMSPGDIGDLTRSGDIAFRVEFSSEIPSYNELYWRGITLEQFDGREWSRRRFRNAQYLGVDKPQLYPWFREIQMLGDPVRYNVIMEPTQQSWVFTLMVPQLTNERLFMRREFQVGTQRPINQRMSYDASSYLDHVVDLELSRQMTINNLSIPENGNEESRAFAEQMYAEAGSDTEFINSILQHIRDNEFFYTLSPSLLGENGIDDFLFNTREGFCEHYASTFTFLMRAAGIPARVVTGYQGGEFNKYNETLIVRQYDAHAWSEVWLEGQGWVRVDPTAAVAPGRIE
jgi:protein-glutamine gamma-glutamyltransferase